MENGKELGVISKIKKLVEAGRLRKQVAKRACLHCEPTVIRVPKPRAKVFVHPETDSPYVETPKKCHR